MRHDQRPDLDAELGRLKDFQRRTVDHVHRRLWTDEDWTKRFLVADEVGLGKTLVARGVIAKTLDHLWDDVERIDIVYICSNRQIAAQNLNRLNVGGFDVDHADRLTMLPMALKDLRSSKVNFVSFTPSTSFTISESGGKWPERVLLFHLLARSLGRRVLRQKGWLRFFTGAARVDLFEREVRRFDDRDLDPVIAEAFARDLALLEFDGRPFSEVLEETVDRFRYREHVQYPISRRRYRLIGRMRKLIAESAVEALEPDLVILDEFQRFKDLLSPDEPGADLARAIFDQTTSRVLMLSATPYRMYTLPDEATGDDHYADFLATVRFLAGEDEAATIADHLTTMREIALYGGDPLAGTRVADAITARLRRVMSRTERLAATPDRNGMLVEANRAPAIPTAGDIRSYRTVAALAERVKGYDVFEYWRSSPYPINLMDDYQVKKKILAAVETQQPDVVEVLRDAEGLLRWEDLENYRDVDPNNAKMRALAADVLRTGADRIAWIPPSLPYYSPRGVFAGAGAGRATKRLVFSAWNVVPKAISLMLSYEVERRASTASGGGGRGTYEQNITGPLRFTREQGRLTGMPVLALLYPSAALARLADPLQVARELDVGLPADVEAVRAETAARVARALEALPAGDPAGRVDERWYWAAPFLLDARSEPAAQAEFLRVMAAWGGVEDDGGQGLVDHVTQAAEFDPGELGARPDDLAEVLADLALAGPGVVALRALARVSGGVGRYADADVRDCATVVSWGLRTLFNRPEIISILRTQSGDRTPYWRLALRHCLDGNLQATLDEYVHVLTESEGLQDKPGVERADALSEVIAEAASIRTVANSVDDFRVDEGTVRTESHNVRAHFAMRFGRGTTEDSVIQREGNVRVAFNSPFWPFVLASTSVGQEGLDFHTYCHAVVHWNLPGNPVDLEQREGRVHRYKGHAVRRNVAARHGDAARFATVDDPWFAMFLAAEEQRPDGESEIFPFWVYPCGDAKIERHLALSPLSKETARYEQLKKSVALYRIAIGQARQEDLVAIAGADRDLSWMQLDLAP